MKKKWSAVILLLLLLCGCTAAPQTVELPPVSVPEPVEANTEMRIEEVVVAASKKPKKTQLAAQESEQGTISQPTPEPEYDPELPMLALTFDDGPSAYTDRLLDYFAQYGGHGTFFVIGQQIDNRSDTVARITEEGHEIGGHSWDHKQLTKLDEYEILEQLRQTRAKIFEYTGVDAKLMRPPYGSFNDQVKTVCAELHVSLINWNVDTLDWQNRNADIVYDTIMRQARDGAIILCHDLHKTTVDAMERVIPALIEQGYQLVTVSQLLTSLGGEIVPGTVYNHR